MSRLLLIVLLLPMAGLWLAAGVGPPHYAVESGSQFKIDGTSTMGPYSCRASGVTGRGQVPEVVASRTAAISAEVLVPVHAFDCGQPRMNRDFTNALKADRHAEIRFTVTQAEILGTEVRPGAWVRVRATGTLRLAGVERPITLLAEGQRLTEGRVRIRGEHALRMTDFGVSPPSGLLGLVRAHDGVVARFDITARSS